MKDKIRGATLDEVRKISSPITDYLGYSQEQKDNFAQDFKMKNDFLVALKNRKKPTP